MFGNRPLRAVAAQNRDALALDDDTNVNIVEIPIQQAQATTQGILEPAAAAAASDLQLINDPFDLGAGRSRRKWRRIARVFFFGLCVCVLSFSVCFFASSFVHLSFIVSLFFFLMCSYIFRREEEIIKIY